MIKEDNQKVVEVTAERQGSHALMAGGDLDREDTCFADLSRRCLVEAFMRSAGVISE